MRKEFSSVIRLYFFVIQTLTSGRSGCLGILNNMNLLQIFLYSKYPAAAYASNGRLITAVGPAGHPTS